MDSKRNQRICLTVVLAFLISTGGNANADYILGTPINLGPAINTSAGDMTPNISTDGLSLFFRSNRPGGYGGHDIWVTTRATTNDDWGIPVNLGSIVSSSSKDSGPSISGDGLSLFFDSVLPGGYGDTDIWVSTRPTLSDPWGEPVNLGAIVNGSYRDSAPSISHDGLELYFGDIGVGPFRPGGYGGGDLWVTTRATTEDEWSAPVNLGPTVNSSGFDASPNISTDGLALFFYSRRGGGYGDLDIWLSKRTTRDDPWSTPVNLGPPVNTSYSDVHPSISADGSTLYFSSNRPGGSGGSDLWQVSIIPIVDFNGDGIVDSADMCIIVDNWGTDQPLCDIGPMPWGDGVVDVQDLIVLAEHLFTYHGIVAHWKLDETEGITARDSVSGNDDVVMGGAIWRPTGGMVDGALELDGVDDCLITTFGVNPAEGSFSILAWIKGGAPGQTVLSEPMGSNWLMTDAEGKLITELASAGGAALISQTVITDGGWHRIALVWDGSHRTLCVDDAIAAQDSQSDLEASGGGLYIGVDKNYAVGTFFSGLIDDVRIYNRALKP